MKFFLMGITLFVLYFAEESSAFWYPGDWICIEKTTKKAVSVDHKPLTGKPIVLMDNPLATGNVIIIGQQIQNNISSNGDVMQTSGSNLYNTAYNGNYRQIGYSQYPQYPVNNYPQPLPNNGI